MNGWRIVRRRVNQSLTIQTPPAYLSIIMMRCHSRHRPNTWISLAIRVYQWWSHKWGLRSSARCPSVAEKWPWSCIAWTVRATSKPEKVLKAFSWISLTKNLTVPSHWSRFECSVQVCHESYLTSSWNKFSQCWQLSSSQIRTMTGWPMICKSRLSGKRCSLIWAPSSRTKLKLIKTRNTIADYLRSLMSQQMVLTRLSTWRPAVEIKEETQSYWWRSTVQSFKIWCSHKLSSCSRRWWIFSMCKMKSSLHLSTLRFLICETSESRKWN